MILSTVVVPLPAGLFLLTLQRLEARALPRRDQDTARSGPQRVRPPVGREQHRPGRSLRPAVLGRPVRRAGDRARHLHGWLADHPDTGKAGQRHPARPGLRRRDDQRRGDPRLHPPRASPVHHPGVHGLDLRSGSRTPSGRGALEVGRADRTGLDFTLPAAAVVGAAASWLAATGTVGVVVVAVSGLALAAGIYAASRRGVVNALNVNDIPTPTAPTSPPDQERTHPCTSTGQPWSPSRPSRQARPSPSSCSSRSRLSPCPSASEQQVDRPSGWGSGTRTGPGRVVAWLCLLAAGLIVCYGLYLIIA